MINLYGVGVRRNYTIEIPDKEDGIIREHVQRMREMPIIEEARQKAESRGVKDLRRIIDIFYVARDGPKRNAFYEITDCDADGVVLGSQMKTYAEMEALLKSEE
ncbi:MAG: hypothetical protein WCK90_01425 [archaeon]